LIEIKNMIYLTVVGK